MLNIDEVNHEEVLKEDDIFKEDEIKLKVIEADAVVKGQTAASSYKPAVLERNIKSSVPPFIEIGDRVVINTSDSSYIEKAKN